MVMPLIGITNITQLNATNLETGVYMFSPYSINQFTSHFNTNLLDQVQIVSVEVWSDALLLHYILDSAHCTLTPVPAGKEGGQVSQVAR